MKEHKSEKDDHVSFYDRWINLLASVAIMFIWRGIAWAAHRWLWPNTTESECFLWIVAAYVALSLPGKNK